MYLGQKKLLDDEILINSLVTEKYNKYSFQNFSSMCWLKKDVHPTHAYYVPIFLGPNRLAISAGDGFVCHSQPAEHLSLSSISYTCCIHVYVLYEWEDVLDNKT